MNNNQKKLTFTELKEKAKSTNQNEVLEKIQGAGWFDCHGVSGYLGKAWKMWEWGPNEVLGPMANPSHNDDNTLVEASLAIPGFREYAGDLSMYNNSTI
jgi:hypothetical protein